MTKDKKSFNRIPKEFQEKYKAHFGKVGMRFVADKISEYNYHKGLTKFGGPLGLPIGTFDSYMIFEDEYKDMCLTYDEVKEYGKGKALSGLHISDLVTYDEPKEVGEFRKLPCEKSERCCEDCKYKYHDHNGEIYCKDDNRVIINPPQSWQYIEG
ncbi:MAG: hypothetical protein K2O54_03485 [Prevotella sp.]|nr:hypothetical protein [Prevotella sp.]